MWVTQHKDFRSVRVCVVWGFSEPLPAPEEGKSPIAHGVTPQQRQKQSLSAVERKLSHSPQARCKIYHVRGRSE